MTETLRKGVWVYKEVTEGVKWKPGFIFCCNVEMENAAGAGNWPQMDKKIGEVQPSSVPNCYSLKQRQDL